MELRGYDNWKTSPDPWATAEPTQLMVDVLEGNLGFYAEDPDEPTDRCAGWVEVGDCGCGEDPAAEDTRIVEEIRTIARREGCLEFIVSSSVDFPNEYGVCRPVDIRALLARALKEA